MKVIWLDAAQEQMEEIYEFLAQQNPKAAVEIYNEIIEEADRLAGFPEMASLEQSLREEAKSYRSLIVRRTYKAIYRIDAKSEKVVIVSVWDCRQDPETLKKRTTKQK